MKCALGHKLNKTIFFCCRNIIGGYTNLSNHKFIKKKTTTCFLRFEVCCKMQFLLPYNLFFLFFLQFLYKCDKPIFPNLPLSLPLSHTHSYIQTVKSSLILTYKKKLNMKLKFDEGFWRDVLLSHFILLALVRN